RRVTPTSRPAKAAAARSENICGYSFATTMSIKRSGSSKSIPGMAAGVTEGLGEIGDIVDVLEAWQRVRVGHVVLSTKVQYYLERAEHCERMAALTSNREVRANFAELPQQWRALPRQHQNLGNPPPQSN